MNDYARSCGRELAHLLPLPHLRNVHRLLKTHNNFTIAMRAKNVHAKEWIHCMLDYSLTKSSRVYWFSLCMWKIPSQSAQLFPQVGFSRYEHFTAETEICWNLKVVRPTESRTASGPNRGNTHLCMLQLHRKYAVDKVGLIPIMSCCWQNQSWRFCGKMLRPSRSMCPHVRKP